MSSLLICRWASSAGGTKKLLRLKRAERRMKIVGTGSRKISKLPVKTKLPSHVTCTRWSIDPALVSSICGRRNLLQIFRRPHWCCLYYAQKLGNKSWGNHCSHVRWLEQFTLHLRIELWTLVIKLQCRAIFMNPAM